MPVALVNWRGPVSSLAGPTADGSGSSLPIPSRGAITGLLGAAFGYAPKSADLLALERALDLAVVVRNPGTEFRDFQTVDITTPRMGRFQLTPDGVIERGGATDKERLIVTRPMAAGFDALIFVAGIDAASVDAALRAPVFDLYLGRRGCIPSLPPAGGIEEGDVDDAVARHIRQGDMLWRLSAPGSGLRFGVDLISMPERDGSISWWARAAA